MWKQLRVPNLDPIVYDSGKILYNWLGYCLGVTETAFNTPRVGYSAWVQWGNTKKRHGDRNIPGGVYVPIWFDGYWKGERVGHVAIYKDGKVWSSPYTSKPYMDVLGSIADVERTYGMTYVGWSEDLAGVDVIQYVNNNATVDQVKDLYREILEREADQGGINTYTRKTYDFVRNDLLQSQERKDLLARKERERQVAEQAAREAEEARLAAEKAAAEAEAQKTKEAEDAAKAEAERLAAEAKAKEEEAARLAEEERRKKEEQAANAPSWGDLVNEQKKTNGFLEWIVNLFKSIFKVS